MPPELTEPGGGGMIEIFELKFVLRFIGNRDPNLLGCSGIKDSISQFVIPKVFLLFVIFEVFLVFSIRKFYLILQIFSWIY
jgi:hypothetical protein